MATVKPIVTTTFLKTEGTSKTYGQVVQNPVTGKFQSISAGVYLDAKTDTIAKFIENQDKKESDQGSSAAPVYVGAAPDVVVATVTSSKFDIIQQIAKGNLNGAVANNIINSSPKVQETIVVPSVWKKPEEIREILKESQKVDLLISLKSKESEALQFNTVQLPDLSAKFEYQFYEVNENDINIQEDQDKDPLLKNDLKNVPKYVKLSWYPVSVKERLESQRLENIDIKNKFLKLDRGVAGYANSNFKKAFNKSKKKVNLIEKDGRKIELVDTHRLDEAFDAIANNNKFSNSIHSVVNVSINNAKQDAFLNVITNALGKLK
jgi:hypothetical protein